MTTREDLIDGRGHGGGFADGDGDGDGFWGPFGGGDSGHMNGDGDGGVSGHLSYYPEPGLYLDETVTTMATPTQEAPCQKKP